MISSAAGSVVFEGAVFSKNFGTNRWVRIYLPPSYGQHVRKRYPVLYLHDGQNAFSTVGDGVAFGWGNWGLDKTVNDLSSRGEMAEIIMVAIDCSSERYLDYRGPSYSYTRSELKDLKRPPPAPGDDDRFLSYSRFLIEELKPKIDHEYRTLSDAANTGVLGSSMGGVASLALGWEHPEVFGKVGSLSGAFQVERKNLIKILKEYTGKPKPLKIYLDSGTVDFSGGDDGLKTTEAVVEQLRRIGWRNGRNLKHVIDEKPATEEMMQRAGLRPEKWREAKTSQHNEFYWRLRAPGVLKFLYPRE